MIGTVNVIDWNDESVRETVRFMVDASYELLGAAAQFAPGDEDAFLTAMAEATECGIDSCDCGGDLPDHWPKPFPKQCDYHRLSRADENCNARAE